MKSIYFWIVAALFGLGILPAAAQETTKVQFTINVPNPDAVACEISYQPYELVKGANVIEVAEYTMIKITGVNPWRLNNVTYPGADGSATTASGYSSGTWYFYPSAEVQNRVFTLEVINIDEFRTATLTINVDDATLVSAMLGGYYTNLQLKDGENTIKFDPAVETYLSISGATSAPIYKVELDGVPVVAQGGAYYTISDLADGMVIDITAKLPDEDRTLTFSYSEDGVGAIDVLVENQPVEDFDHETLVVKLGSAVTLAPRADFRYEKVTVNGQEIGYTNYNGNYEFNYRFVVMEDTEIYIAAHPFGKIKATVVIPNPEFVTFYKGYEYQGNVVALQPGENELEMMENESIYSWTISKDAIRNSVTLNGTELSEYYTQVTFKDGDVLVFDLAEKSFDLKAIAWIDNINGQYISANADGTGYGFFMFGSAVERNNYATTMVDGYNEIFFYEGMNPFSISWSSSNPDYENAKVYLNDEPVERQYEYGVAREVTLANNDVLKFFMDGDPVECAVAIEIDEDVEANVVKDIVTDVENPAAGFDCFAGTQVAVSGTGIKVTVNGETIVADKTDDEAAARATDDTYTFIITDPTTKVEVKKDSESGVETIGVENDAAEVFNTLGVKVGNSLKELPAGIYVVKGKKVLVK